MLIGVLRCTECSYVLYGCQIIVVKAKERLMISNTQASILRAASKKSLTVSGFLSRYVDELKDKNMVVTREGRGRFLYVLPVKDTFIETTEEGTAALAGYDKKNRGEESLLFSNLLDFLLLLF